MFKWYKKVVLENYANFKGRARRSEFWYFFLMNFIFTCATMIIDKSLGLTVGIQSVYSLLLFLPGIAVSVRRLHDVGKSGWWLLILYILMTITAVALTIAWGLGRNLPSDSFKDIWPYALILATVAGGIWILVLHCMGGDEGANKYGSDPKFHGDEISEIGTA